MVSLIDNTGRFNPVNQAGENKEVLNNSAEVTKSKVLALAAIFNDQRDKDAAHVPAPRATPSANLTAASLTAASNRATMSSQGHNYVPVVTASKRTVSFSVRDAEDAPAYVRGVHGTYRGKEISKVVPQELAQTAFITEGDLRKMAENIHSEDTLIRTQMAKDTEKVDQDLFTRLLNGAASFLRVQASRASEKNDSVRSWMQLERENSPRSTLTIKERNEKAKVIAASGRDLDKDSLAAQSENNSRSIIAVDDLSVKEWIEKANNMHEKYELLTHVVFFKVQHGKDLPKELKDFLVEHEPLTLTRKNDS